MFGIHSTSYAGQLLSVPCNLPLLWISQDRSVRLPSLFITSTCVVDTTITLKQMLRHIEPSSLRKLHSYGYLIPNASTFIVGSPKIIMGFDSMHSLTHSLKDRHCSREPTIPNFWSEKYWKLFEVVLNWQ